MRRVAYVCADPRVAVFGNQAVGLHVQALLRALQALGAQVQLFAAHLGGTRPPGLERVRVHTLSPLPRGLAVERERAALRGNAELRSLIDDAGPFDMVYERYSLWSYAGMEAAAAANIAGLVEVSAPLIEEESAYGGLVDRDGAEQVAQRTFRAAGAVIATSHTIANYLQHRFPQTRARVTVVPSGIDPARFPARQQPFERRRAGMFTIGAVGRFGPRDGLSLLLDAFAQVRDTVADARLLICHDEREREALRSAIEQRELHDVLDLASRMSGAEIAELLGRIDVAIAPHDGRTEFHSAPVPLHEFMAAGVPVVASRGAELDGLVEDGTTGLLCAPGDAAALAHAVELLAGNPLLRARLGADGRAHVLRHHTWDGAAERVLNLAAVLASSVPAA
jgi:glycosyltransferase involved in cell wall biosynthesis